MIQVTDRFYINADSNCYMLQEKTTVQEKASKNYGKEIFNTIGYYSTIESCLKGILKTTTREYISKSDKNSINDLITQIKSFENYLKSLKIEV